MKNSEKAKIVVELVRRKVRASISDYINASADLVKAQTEQKMWEKEEKESGMIPYGRGNNIDILRKRMDKSYEEKEACQEVLDYAIEVFINKIGD